MPWWPIRKWQGASAGATLEERRRRYAAEITRHSGVYHERVEHAFATTPREHYLAPPPWVIFAPGGVFRDETSDPAELYQDVLVVLDRARGINNGQPSLHAAWMAALDPQPGETVVQIGAGTGYYTAILAQLVTPGGHVHAYEIEEDLAEIARTNLASIDAATVHAASGVGATLPAADIIYVNASAPAPDAAWLAALKPAGRLIFPWQSIRQRGGIALHVTRTGRGYRAAAIMEVAFIPCVGAVSPPASGGRASTSDVMATRSVWLTQERPPDETAIVVGDQVWLSSQAI
jgi:protein-L-isoaspartate(D-aspartate) O-methyltransferase